MHINEVAGRGNVLVCNNHVSYVIYVQIGDAC